MIKVIVNSVLLGSILVVAACRSSKQTAELEVKGEFANISKILAQYPGVFKSDTITLSLYEVPFGSEATPVQLDTAKVSPSSASFSLHTKAKPNTLLDLMIENGPVIPIVNDGNSIILNIDLLNRDRYYNVQGSVATEQVREFIFTYSDKSNLANNAFNRLDSLKLTKANDTLLLAATNEKNATVESVNNYLKNFLTSVQNPTVAAFVLGAAANTLPAAEYESVLSKMIQRYPADSNLTFLQRQVEIRKNQSASAQGASQIWTGKPAPDLSLPDANGKEISLSSFRGKYVLVDFWASWCRPCRMENPNVVKAYQQFKNKNFTILGVSLDKDKESWLEAIKQDNLTWTHISDLAYWNSKAVDIFKFEGIPYNILINPEGIVIGESLRGPELENKLSEVLK